MRSPASLLLSCLVLGTCLSCSRVASRAIPSAAITTTKAVKGRSSSTSSTSQSPSYVAVGGIQGAFQELGNKIEQFKKECAELQPKIIDLNRRPSDVLRELVVVGSTAGSSMIQGAGMGYCFGRIGVFKGKEAMGTYKRFYGDKAPHMLGVKQAKSYATFVCLFSAFEGIPRALRGIDDNWNTVMGSMGVGMYMARRMGTASMIQGGLTWGAFSMLAERLRGPPKKEEGEEADPKKGTSSRRRRRGASTTAKAGR